MYYGMESTNKRICCMETEIHIHNNTQLYKLLVLATYTVISDT